MSFVATKITTGTIVYLHLKKTNLHAVAIQHGVRK